MRDAHNIPPARSGAPSHRPRASQGGGRAAGFYPLLRTWIFPRTKIKDRGFETIWVGYDNDSIIMDGETVSLTEAIAYVQAENVVLSVLIDDRGYIRLWNTMLDSSIGRQATRNWLLAHDIQPNQVLLRFWK